MALINPDALGPAAAFDLELKRAALRDVITLTAAHNDATLLNAEFLRVLARAVDGGSAYCDDEAGPPYWPLYRLGVLLSVSLSVAEALIRLTQEEGFDRAELLGRVEELIETGFSDTAEALN